MAAPGPEGSSVPSEELAPSVLGGLFPPSPEAPTIQPTNEPTDAPTSNTPASPGAENLAPEPAVLGGDQKIASRSLSTGAKAGIAVGAAIGGTSRLWQIHFVPTQLLFVLKSVMMLDQAEIINLGTPFSIYFEGTNFQVSWR